MNAESSLRLLPTVKPVTLKVSEVFQSFQGEGPSCGRPCTFLRLALCNLSCSWCDSKYTWDWNQYDPAKEILQVKDTDLIEQIWATSTGRLVITGGEPLLQQPHLGRILRFFFSAEWAIEIETNGTIDPNTEVLRWVTQFNVSPKLKSSGSSVKTRVHNAVATFAKVPQAVLKFVICSEDDLVEVDQLVTYYSVEPHRVWLMPEGRTVKELNTKARWIAELAATRNWNFSNRMHVLLYGDKRGV